jgi:hypothetical protein
MLGEDSGCDKFNSDFGDTAPPPDIRGEEVLSDNLGDEPLRILGSFYATLFYG